MKYKNKITQVFILYLICLFAHCFELFVIRTDQTIIGEAFINKLFGIAVVLIAAKLYGFTLPDIRLKSDGIFSHVAYGLAFGFSMFTIGYLIEILMLIKNGTFEDLQFYISAYAIDSNIATSTSLLFIVICILGNIINVLMEESFFRGLFPKLLENASTIIRVSVCASLFGLWHVIGPIRNYVDGESSLSAMIANIIMLFIASALVAIKLLMLAKITGSLYMGMADHFFNNTIVNMVHVIGSTGTDQMMFLRITVAQLLSFTIVLIIFLRKGNRNYENQLSNC